MKAQKNTEQLLLRLPPEMKSRMETAAKCEGITTAEWARDALQVWLGLQNVCPHCSFVNAGRAKFCSECGTPLAQSKRAIYREWVKELIREEFGEEGFRKESNNLI